MVAKVMRRGFAGHRAGLLVVLFLATLGLWLIGRFPVIYWHDPYVRLVQRERIIVQPFTRWLPLLQFLIFMVSKLTPDLTVLRGVLAVIAAGTVVSASLLFSRLFTPVTGVVAAFWLASSPMFIALATVPYQEVLFLLWLFLGLYFLVGTHPRDRYAAAGCLNLACLTRYEGWLLVPLLMAEAMRDGLRRRGVKGAAVQGARTLGLFGVVPLLWLALGPLQVFPHETAILSRLHPGYLMDFLRRFGNLLWWQARPEVLLLGTFGLVESTVWGGRKASHRRILSFLLLVLAVLVFVAPRAPHNLRRTFIPLVFLTLYAAPALVGGLEALSRLLCRRGGTALVRGALRIGLIAVTAWVTARGLAAGVHLVAAASRDPVLRTPYEVGRWLRVHAPPDVRVLAFTDHPVQRYALALYADLPLDRVIDATAWPVLGDTGAEGIAYLVLLTGTPPALPGAMTGPGKPVWEARVGPARIWKLSK